MRYHRDAHNKSVQKKTPPAQNYPPVTAQQPPQDRDGLENSPLGNLAAELRLAIIQYRIQNLQKVGIVAKATLQDEDSPVSAASPGESSLVFASRSALSKTCYELHTQYANQLQFQLMNCKIPSLALQVVDFDFSPFTRDLFPNFKDSHREYFNARPGAITIHLTLTPSFFARHEGERGRTMWLALRDVEREQKKRGLSQWLEWRKVQEKAGKQVSVAYRLERNYAVEGVEDREALRMFLLLFDPLSKGEGELGGIWPEVRRVFKVIKDLEDHKAQEAEVEEEYLDEGMEEAQVEEEQLEEEEEELEEEDYSD